MRIPVATIAGCGGLGLLLLTSLAVPPHALAGGVVGTGTPESCTEAALDAALAGGGSVTFRCGLAPFKITVTSEKTITKNTTLDGGGRIILSGGGTTRILSVAKHTALSLANISLTDGHSGQDQTGGAVGGAIYVTEGKLTATNSTFSDNSADALGGAIFNLLGRLTLTDCTFSNNHANDGGAVRNDSNMKMSVTNSTFSNNSGAAIASSGRGKDTVANCTFSNNTGSRGGAINRAGPLSVSNSTFSNNSSGGSGGALSLAAGRGSSRVSVTNCTFVSNSSVDGGGAIDSSGRSASEPLSVTDCTFVSNNTAGAGGAIERSFGKLAVSNSVFSNNSAGSGGAIWSANLTVTNSTFTNNSAGSGGAINGAGVASVANSTFFANSSTADGGAIFSLNQMTVTNCTFSNNSAAEDIPGLGPGGAAIHQFGGQLALTNTIIANSLASENCVGVGSGADRGHNIDSGTSCSLDSSKGSLSNTDPKLDPAGLADNGGPTQTIAVEAGSPAINGGNSRACTLPPVGNYDQRSLARPGLGSSNCTIGAYEFYP